MGNFETASSEQYCDITNPFKKIYSDDRFVPNPLQPLIFHKLLKQIYFDTYLCINFHFIPSPDRAVYSCVVEC